MAEDKIMRESKNLSILKRKNHKLSKSIIQLQQPQGNKVYLYYRGKNLFQTRK